MHSSLFIEITSLPFHQFAQVSGYISKHLASFLCKLQVPCSNILQEEYAPTMIVPVAISNFCIYLPSEKVVEN